jgi:predicted nuclease of predicted toxin-antitoxin system
MKFLGDMGVSPLTIQMLRQEGHDAIHLYEQQLERLPDSLILEKAKKEQRIILTFDLDFGDLLVINRDKLPSVIIFRLQNAHPKIVNARLLLLIAECSQDLNAGAITIVDDTRYRLRRLPI